MHADRWQRLGADGKIAVVVIAQDGHHVGDVQTGLVAAEDPAGAVEPAASGAEVGFGVLISGGEATVRLPPALGFGMLADARGGGVPRLGDGQQIRDSCALVDPGGDPAMTGGFENPCAGRIGNDERVLVSAVMGGFAAATLTVLLDQVSDDVDGVFGGAGALETEPHQIHTDERLLVGGLAGVDGFVADGYAPFVDAHLESPEPVGCRADQLPCGCDLGNLEVLGADRCAGRVVGAGNMAEGLTFIGGAVAVFGEDHVAVGGEGRNDDGGVAGKWVGVSQGSRLRGAADRLGVSIGKVGCATEVWLWATRGPSASLGTTTRLRRGSSRGRSRCGCSCRFRGRFRRRFSRGSP